MQGKHWISALALTAGLVVGSIAQAQTTVRIAWYSDGNEGEVVSDLLRCFEAQNKDIKVVLDQVLYKAITENLPVQLASGQGPDIARVVDLGGISRYALDLRPHLKDAAYWEKNFGPFLPWMRPEGDNSAITGFMTQLTVTGPFVNKTLFEQAGIAMPGAKASWEGWAKAFKEVAAKVKAPFPLAMDRSGHRFFSLAVAQGAKAFDAKGEPAVIDDGFRRAAQLVVDWHKSGVMAKELWGSVSGTAYRGANDEFKNAQVVMYHSGSWQIAQFDKTVGDAFDWVAVPSPCGPGGCSGMPGGAGLVAIKTTKSPEAVAKVMEYLASEPVLSEFYARSLFVPGHLGIAAKGLDYASASAQAKAALKVFSGQVAQLSPVAYQLQGYTSNRVIFNAVISRLGQAISGEGSLDEAYKRIETDIARQIAEPKALSGGQRQRVAIGRAIVRDPKIFLFDEPLSNLDAELRVATRKELAALHAEIGGTMIYVTHDQVEAMTLAHRIVVLQGGRIEQVGTPLELYNRPDNLFVAGFIGSPRMNLLPGKVVRPGAVALGEAGHEVACQTGSLAAGASVTLGIRPEHLALAAQDGGVPLAIELVERLGGESYLYGASPGLPQITLRLDGQSEHQRGSNIALAFPQQLLHLFDENGRAVRS